MQPQRRRLIRPQASRIQPVTDWRINWVVASATLVVPGSDRFRSPRFLSGPGDDNSHHLTPIIERDLMHSGPGDFKGNKRSLPAKPCATCGRSMTWRKRWARNWDEVKYCSDFCRRTRLKTPTTDTFTRVRSPRSE
jgi:hypothetical protein